FPEFRIMFFQAVYDNPANAVPVDAVGLKTVHIKTPPELAAFRIELVGLLIDAVENLSELVVVHIDDKPDASFHKLSLKRHLVLVLAVSPYKVAPIFGKLIID